MKILVTYATQNGSTRSIAERIQARIAAADIGNITLEPVDTKLSVNDFDAIIIGSCIHAGSWVRKGQQYIKNNEKVLRENPKPTWAFSVGMPPDGDKMKAEEKQTEKWLLKHIALKGHKLFQGMFLEKDMSGCFKFFFSCFGGKYEDKRDWNAMDEWADEIVKELRVEQRNL